MASKPSKVLYWFRTDLRLHDSPALLKSLELRPVEFFPVWCWDPNYVYKTAVGPNRWQFLLDSMKDLSESIRRVNPRSKLFVIRGDPLVVLPYVWQEWGITHIGFEADDDNRYAKPRDRSIIDLAEKSGIQSIVHPGCTLYDQNLLMEVCQGNLVKTYREFLKLIEKLGPPSAPQKAPTHLPDPGSTSLTIPSEFTSRWHKSIEEYQDPQKDRNLKHRIHPDKEYHGDLSGPTGQFDIPTMEEMGIEPATTPHRGGETVALNQLEAYLEDKMRVLKFEKPKTSPAEFGPASTTVLSPHLKFGTLSSRLFYHRLIEIQESNPKVQASTPPESLTGQLLWREFFHLHQSQIENYHQMQGNRICRYIDWRLRVRPDGTKDMKKDIEAENWLLAWREGLTGFPWIDAIMRQLKSEGWIHHLARHSVACFLTRGNLYISWERGAEVFDDLLIDWDPSLNSANWYTSKSMPFCYELADVCFYLQKDVAIGLSLLSTVLQSLFPNCVWEEMG